MSSIEINISNYVTDDEIKAAILSEIRKFVAEQTEDTMKRIFSNGAYEILSKVVDDSLHQDRLDFVKDTVNQLLSDKDSIKYRLFRQPNVWDTEPNAVAKVFSDCVGQKRKEIADAVDNALKTLNARDFKTFLIRYAVKDKQ